MRKYKFFSHFNRVNMFRKDPRVWTVHYRGTCYQGEKIVYRVPTETVFKPEGAQPRARVIGWASAVEVYKGAIYVL